jgi:hypothetical protein
MAEKRTHKTEAKNNGKIAVTVWFIFPAIMLIVSLFFLGWENGESAALKEFDLQMSKFVDSEVCIPLNVGEHKSKFYCLKAEHNFLFIDCEIEEYKNDGVCGVKGNVSLVDGYIIAKMNSCLAHINRIEIFAGCGDENNCTANVSKRKGTMSELISCLGNDVNVTEEVKSCYGID